MSDERSFTFGTVLNIILINTNTKASYFAGHYVFKDPSLVSKWLHDTQFPTTDTFPNIVRFAMEQSAESARKIMRIEIDRLIQSSALDDETRNTLEAISEFDAYLQNVLNVLANLKNRVKRAEERGNADPGGAPPPGLTAGHNERSGRKGSVLEKAGRAATALLASVAGQLLWLLIFSALKLHPQPGRLGIVPGFWGAAWGLMMTLPVIGFALLSRRKKSDFIREAAVLKIRSRHQRRRHVGHRPAFNNKTAIRRNGKRGADVPLPFHA